MIPETPGIYTITNLVNGKLYVGLTKNLKERKKSHFKTLKYEIHGNPHLQSAVNRYGEENFLFEVLVECEEEFLCSEEHYWCNLLKVHDRKYGYNIEPTNPYGYPITLSEETKRKMSENHADVSGNNNPFYGKKHTREALEKISESSKNRIYTQERSEKIRKFHTGRKQSIEQRDNTAIANGRKPFNVYKCITLNKGRDKSIIVISKEFLYESINTGRTGEELHIPPQCIIKCLQGKTSQTKGYTFIYKHLDNEKENINSGYAEQWTI